jgi:uridine kinase
MALMLYYLKVTKLMLPICDGVIHFFTCEGILAFSDSDVRDKMDMKLFVDTDADTRLIRRIRRDIRERGRSLEGTLIQYETTVRPSFDLWIGPLKVYADVIIPRG